MNAPRSPTSPQWKIDLVREAIRIIEGEKGRRVTAAMIARRNPSLTMADIEIVMKRWRRNDVPSARREKIAKRDAVEHPRCRMSGQLSLTAPSGQLLLTPS
jgi:hypothetical protein